MKQKTGKYFNVSKCNLVFFILDLSKSGLLKGMCLKLKGYLPRKNSDFPEFIVNRFSFKGKSKSQSKRYSE